jgi:thiamine-phosphate pyrophosphorylase
MQGTTPIFYYITDRRALRRESVAKAIGRAVDWGVDYVQVREKDLSDSQLFRLVQEVLGEAESSGCRVLVNGRADIAKAAGTAGVHLPSSGINAGDIRPWQEKDFIIGASAHSLREARLAESAGADYLLLGPVFETPSKLRYGPPLGLTALRRICSKVSIPIFALGGIDAASVPSVLEAGAAGIAGISLFQQELRSGSISRAELLRNAG